MVPTSEVRPEDVERLNKVLEGAILLEKRANALGVNTSSLREFIHNLMMDGASSETEFPNYWNRST